MEHLAKGTHKDLFDIGGDVYQVGDVTLRDVWGQPMDRRWECSRAHFEVNRETYALNGWELTPGTERAGWANLNPAGDSLAMSNALRRSA